MSVVFSIVMPILLVMLFAVELLHLTVGFLRRIKPSCVAFLEKYLKGHAQLTHDAQALDVVQMLSRIITSLFYIEYL